MTSTNAPLIPSAVHELERDANDEWIFPNAEIIGETSSYGTLFEVSKRGYILKAKHYPYFVLSEVIGAAEPSSLFSAFSKAGLLEERIIICFDTPTDFDPLESKIDDTYHIEFEGDQAVVVIEQRYRNATFVPEGIKEMAEEVASRHGCKVISITTDPDVDLAGWNSDWVNSLDLDADAMAIRKKAVDAELKGILDGMARTARISIAAGPDTMTVGEVAEAGRDLAAVLAALNSGPISAAVIQTWLRAGRFELIVGTQESEFLEVKSRAYALRSPAPADLQLRQKIEVAQDVARFANGDVDAVLVLGYSEAARDGVPTISKLVPIPLDQLDATQYQKILDERIVPAVDGLGVEVVEVEPGMGVMMIFVPRQPKELQPYLVQGVVVGDKVEGAFFSIVRRRGEGSITTSATQIHGYIVAGRAALRAGLRDDAAS